jgi:hypothetical protein
MGFFNLNFMARIMQHSNFNVTESGAELKGKFEFLPLTSHGPYTSLGCEKPAVNFEIMTIYEQLAEVSTVYFVNATARGEMETRNSIS